MASTILPILSTLDKYYQSGTFRTHNEIERDLKDARIQLLAEIFLDIQSKMKSLAHTLLQTYYGLIVVLLIYMDAEISIILCQGFSEKNTLSLLSI